ncbi:MAG: bifunctional demethylmenaquinone methyltransferase/2-methoxy-6-polyprenyl-1,4-benzoquinol methylase UbiE [Chlamydia sp.]
MSLPPENLYSAENPDTIQEMFNSIAPTYDQINSCISLGLHTIWNKKMVDMLIQKIPAESKSVHFVDLCCGTGAITFLYDTLRRKKRASLSTEITGIDFSSQMLEKAKSEAQKRESSLQFLEADATQVPMASEKADQIGIAYGLRNIQNRENLFHEIFRLLKPNGHIVILELTRPPSRFFRSLHASYLRCFIPFIGMCIRQKKPYEYLASSIEKFVPIETVMDEMKRSGFRDITAKSLTFGIATLFTAYK